MKRAQTLSRVGYLDREINDDILTQGKDFSRQTTGNSLDRSQGSMFLANSGTSANHFLKIKQQILNFVKQKQRE